MTKRVVSSADREGMVAAQKVLLVSTDMDMELTNVSGVGIRELGAVFTVHIGSMKNDFVEPTRQDHPLLGGLVFCFFDDFVGSKNL